MFMAYRGFSTILIAPVCGLLLVALAGKAILPAFTELFMIKTVGYVKSFFHKTSYLDVAIISIFKGSASFLAIILFTLFGNF